MPSIRVAQNDRDYAAFAGLVQEYVAWGRACYPDLPWFIDAVFGHQALEALPGSLALGYGPPHGKTLLATHDGIVQACGAYRDLGDGVCEMKRVFVPQRWQGRGWGRRLCEALIESARADGYALMRLDTLDRMTAAAALYRSLGFTACAPYHDYPPALRPHLRFMERPLARPAA